MSRRVHQAFLTMAFAVASISLSLPVSHASADEPVVELREGDVQRGIVAAAPIGVKEANQALEVESAAIKVTLPSGEHYPGYLITAYEPESRLFWWTFQGAGPGDPDDRIGSLPAGLTFFVSDNEILGVELGTAPPALWILRSASRAESLADGRRAALAQVGSSARRIQEGTARWMRVVSLASALPRDFYHHPEHARPRLELTVTSIERRPGGWKVTLEGRSGRTAEVLLNELLVIEAAEETPVAPGP